MGRKAVSAPGDISNKGEVEAIAEKAQEAFGGVDILVNNAGINIVKPVREMSGEEWLRVMNVNLNGVFLCSKIIGEQMINRGSGRIINIASMVGINPFPSRGPYATSKAGVIMFTRELAIEWAKYGITVNAIAPGFVKSDMLLDRIKKGDISKEAILRRVPIKRLADPIEIGNLASFIASEDASYITGQVFTIDGGYTAYGFIE